MRIQLFDFIDDTLEYYERKMPSFQYAQKQVLNAFQNMFSEKEDSVVNFYTRIKKTTSLKEKLIRNQFYLDYSTPEEAIAHLSDLIGITIQCRFIRNETEIYKKLFQFFENDSSGYSVCVIDKNIFMNLRMPQPQIQRNGFTIFRIDGFYMFNYTRINFELQIKSLVHTFWSEIEHEVVYKNPDFVMYDNFNRNMLGAIRDNLDVVDRQLEIMYNEISHESKRSQIGMDEQGFKLFVSRSINDLVNRKMKESVGFTTDFKKCSATISQYIYLHDFMADGENRVKMVDYLERISVINEEPIDFSSALTLSGEYHSRDIFCDILGKYMQTVINSNFRWHVFFTVLFEVEQGDNLTVLDSFCSIIRKLLIQPRWYRQTFESFGREVQETMHFELAKILAEALVDTDKIDIVHEDKLYRCMNIFRAFTDSLPERYSDGKTMLRDIDEIRNDLYHQISILFK
ncbi:MAG: hypothetical protein E7185_04130 [Erysipelotrichaceae bacterium]|nr:hypothetical protein [Erysipelotrichaceae bacterium]